jgi:lipopolysaccharide assembly outer membrane protein LptD (OstA)
MDHWHKVLPGKILDVRYEDIVNDIQAETRKVLEFLGLEWSDSCVNFHENKRVVHTASNSQVRQPLFSSSIGRWRHYEVHLSAVRARLSEYL